MSKFIQNASGIIVTIAVALSAYICVLMFYPYKTIEFKEGNLQTEKTEYARGEYLKFRSHYVKHINLAAQVTRSFEDGVVYQLPTVTTNNRSGEGDFWNSSVTIPNCLPDEKYIFKSTVVYKLNPFRTIMHELESNEFTIRGDLP